MMRHTLHHERWRRAQTLAWPILADHLEIAANAARGDDDAPRGQAKLVDDVARARDAALRLGCFEDFAVNAGNSPVRQFNAAYTITEGKFQRAAFVVGAD